MTFRPPYFTSGATTEPDGEVGDAPYNDHDAFALAGLDHTVGSHQTVQRQVSLRCISLDDANYELWFEGDKALALILPR